MLTHVTLCVLTALVGLWSSRRLTIVGFAVVSFVVGAALTCAFTFEWLPEFGVWQAGIAWLILNISFVVSGIYFLSLEKRNSGEKLNLRSIIRFF